MAFNSFHGAGYHDFQAEINQHLQRYGLPVRCGRRVRTDGDCGYDSVLANLEDGAIRQNISEMAKNANLHSVENLRETIALFMDTNKELQKLDMFIAYKEAVKNEPENKGLSWSEYLYKVAHTKN